LIEKGAKIDVRNKHSETPLHTALRLINPKVAKVLIENGADVNATTSNGLTPLHLAGDREVAELLLARGAKIDVKDASGKTPLDQAIALNRTEVVRLLRARQIKD
jgi:ankyrin repeat protein